VGKERIVVKVEEAKQKWCPFKDSGYDSRTCIGDDCMAWAEISAYEFEEIKGGQVATKKELPEDQKEGYCIRLCK